MLDTLLIQTATKLNVLNCKDTIFTHEKADTPGVNPVHVILDIVQIKYMQDSSLYKLIT